MVAALRRHKLNMFKLQEGKFSPRGLVWGTLLGPSSRPRIAALVLIMTWHRIDDKPLSESKVAQFNDAHLCLLASMS